MNNVETLLNVFGVSASEAARWVEVDRSRVVRWKDVEQPPMKLAIAFGVRYDWLIGESSTMWSDKVVAMQRDLRLYLATNEAMRAMTTSKRVTSVLAWLANHAPQSLGGAAGVERYLTAILHLTSIDAYRDVAQGVVPAGDTTVKRLAEWCDVPVEWFEDGRPERLQCDPYESVVRLAKSLGVSAADVEAAVYRLAQRDSII
jgi:hypothetical protein